jgi:4a-hydroxytetrahydrobiopterin dehydratase
MTAVTPLTSDELNAALAQLPDWSVRDGKLHAEFRFADFVAAFAFMTKVAFAAEAAGHHPEWFNVYNRVHIDLVTHDAGNAISHKDIELAQTVSKLAAHS